MKKALAIFAITALVACGGATTTEVKTDSTAVVSDSTSVATTATPTVDTTSVVK